MGACFHTSSITWKSFFMSDACKTVDNTSWFIYYLAKTMVHIFFSERAAANNQQLLIACVCLCTKLTCLSFVFGRFCSILLGPHTRSGNWRILARSLCFCGSFNAIAVWRAEGSTYRPMPCKRSLGIRWRRKSVWTYLHWETDWEPLFTFLLASTTANGTLVADLSVESSM